VLCLTQSLDLSFYCAQVKVRECDFEQSVREQVYSDTGDGGEAIVYELLISDLGGLAGAREF